MRLLEVFLLLELKDRLAHVANALQKKIYHRLMRHLKTHASRGLPGEWKKVLFDVLVPEYDTNGLHGDSTDITDEQINKRSEWIVEWFSQFDPTKNKKYTDWLIRQWIDERILLEDMGSAKRALETFEEHKKALKQLDLSEYDVNSAPESPNVPPPERRGDLNAWKDYRMLSAVMRPLTGTQPAGEKVSNFLKKPDIQDHMNHPVPDPVKAFGSNGEFDFHELRSNYVDEDGEDNFDTMDWYNGFTSKPDDIATTSIKPIYKSDRLAVLQPNTKDAACELGRGTEWCTSATESENAFWDYAPDGPLYVILTDKMGKFQWHFETDQFMNVHDEPLSEEELARLAENYPELKTIFASEALRRNHEWLTDPTVWTPEKIDQYIETFGNAKPFMPAIRRWDGKVSEDVLQHLEKIALQSPESAWAYMRNPTPELYKNSIIANADRDDNESAWNVRQIVGNARHIGMELDDEALKTAVNVTATALERIDPERIKQNPELVFDAVSERQYGADVFRNAAATVNDTTYRRESDMSPETAKAIMDVIRDHPKGKEVVDRFAGHEEVVRYLDYFGTKPWLFAYDDAKGRSAPNTMAADIQGMDHMAQTIERYPMPNLDFNELLGYLIRSDTMHMETFKAIEKAMGGELPIEIQQAMVKKSPGFIAFMDNPNSRLEYEAHRDMETGGRAYRAKQSKEWADEKAAAQRHADAGGDPWDFKWDANESITEGVSPVLYHSSSIHNVRDMLTDNSIRLTPNFGTKAEQGHEPKGKIYYLSTARSKTGGYAYPVSDYQKQGAMIVLDGRALMSAGYSGKALDYWGPEFRALGKDEMEDRIFSDKPTVPNAAKYIKEIHILFDPDDADSRRDLVARVVKDLGYKAKRLDVPLYVYTDQQAFAMLNKQKSLKVSSVDSTADKLPFPDTDVEPRDWRSGPPKNYFGGWIELLKVNDESQLSELGKKTLYNAHYSDASKGLDADIHNARTNNQRPYLDKFLAALKQLNINSTDELMTYINNKFSQ